MILEARYYDDGTAKAKLHKDDPWEQTTESSEQYDSYVEEVGPGGDYTTLEDWLEQLEIETDDIIPLVLALDAGEWVDITAYI